MVLFKNIDICPIHGPKNIIFSAYAQIWASSILLIICKHFYLNNIINECKTNVGITAVNDQPVIEINDNIHIFINDIGIKVDSKVSLLPHMFSSHKFHKPSLKFRYVISYLIVVLSL